MPPIGMAMMAGFGTELIYSFVIVVVSLMVYFGTRELYELTSHKGIKYFRYSFLFFGIAHIFRSIIKFFFVFFNINTIISISPRILNPITFSLFMYFSSIAVFYLLYSVMWKKWNHHSETLFIFHLVAIILSLIVISSTNALVLLFVNIFLFILVTLVFSIAHIESKTKKKSSLYIIYFLLFLFWTLNIIDIFIPRFLQTYQLMIYLVSSAIFLTILYKVLKRAGDS